jgi:hypothetical protein
MPQLKLQDFPVVGNLAVDKSGLREHVGAHVGGDKRDSGFGIPEA